MNRRGRRSGTNKEIRKILDDTGVMQWQLAEWLGIHETTISKMFRHEMPAEEQERMISCIRYHTEKRDAE